MMVRRSKQTYKMIRNSNLGLVMSLLVVGQFLSACGDSDQGLGGDGDSASGGGNASGGTFNLGAGGASAGGTSGSGANQGAGGVNGTGATGSGADQGAGGTVMASGGFTSVTCDNQSPALSVEHLDVTAVAELGAPFDTDKQDLSGPLDWAPQYGKSPEIIPFSSGDELDLLFQDQGADDVAYVVHVSPAGGPYAITTSYRVGSLGRIMGLTRDPDGNYYVATGVDEDEVVDATYPPNKIHRPDIVRVVKFDTNGCVLMESDVDMARGAAEADSEIIVNPMVAATSRLVWGDDRLLLVHGHNTEPDLELDGTRHQKAISTFINALDGSVTRTSTMWASHSFDQRALYDGTGFVELHLGDAYPRTVALGHYGDNGGGTDSYAAYHIKGALGANNTFTRLGGVVQSSDPSYGYLVLFATERSTVVEGDGLVLGTRDVALVRILKDFKDARPDNTIFEEGGATSSQTVTSSDKSQTNAVHWLTELAENTHAERPRITQLSEDKYLVLFEQWTVSGKTNTYQGTFALTVDSAGAVLSGPTKLTGNHHIARGDDITTLGGRGLYVTGGDGALHLNLVAADLAEERVSLP